jgi:transcription elongation GreA/GreB family factor
MECNFRATRLKSVNWRWIAGFSPHDAGKRRLERQPPLTMAPSVDIQTSKSAKFRRYASCFEVRRKEELTEMKATHGRITVLDRCRLGSLLTARECRAWGRPQCLSALSSRLELAEEIPKGHVARNVVKMNSKIILTELESNRRRQVTLAYPQDCDSFNDGVSVFDPLGLELIGSAVGDVVTNGDAKFRVTSVH